MTERTPNPPEDKLKRWEDDILNERENVDVVLDCTWKDAYRAGADAELEACCEAISQVWQMDHVSTERDVLREVHAIRRPKPPSLAKEALDIFSKKLMRVVDPDGFDTIRAALERLQELENNG